MDKKQITLLIAGIVLIVSTFIILGSEGPDHILEHIISDLTGQELFIHLNILGWGFIIYFLWERLKNNL